jgi:hypothetical protein
MDASRRFSEGFFWGVSIGIIKGAHSEQRNPGVLIEEKVFSRLVVGGRPSQPVWIPSAYRNVFGRPFLLRKGREEKKRRAIFAFFFIISHQVTAYGIT